MPNSSTISPTDITDVSRNSCIELTSPCRRDISRPTSVLSMKLSETRCRWLEHGAAQVGQHVLGHLADDAFLHMAGGVVDEDDHRESADRPDQHRPVELARRHAVVDGVADDQRDRQLRQREHQHRGDRDEDPALIRASRSSRCAARCADRRPCRKPLPRRDASRRQPWSAVRWCLPSRRRRCCRHHAAPTRHGRSSSGRSCRS